MAKTAKTVEDTATVEASPVPVVLPVEEVVVVVAKQAVLTGLV